MRGIVQKRVPKPDARILFRRARTFNPKKAGTQFIWLDKWTPTYLRSVLKYDHLTGALTWRANGKVAGHIHVSKEAGRLKSYRVVRLDGKRVMAHRLIWAMHKDSLPGELEIDHQDGDGLNNRISNLRLVCRVLNSRNCKLNSRNTSGYPGVSYNKHTGLWKASIRVHGKVISLGTYSTLEDAVSVRKRCEALLDYHLNHGRVT